MAEKEVKPRKEPQKPAPSENGETEQTAAAADEGTTTVRLETTAKELKDEDRVREMSFRDAQNLLKYEAANGMKNWKLSPEQGLEFKNGRINRTSSPEA
jgi:hypothetical protein